MSCFYLFYRSGLTSLGLTIWAYQSGLISLGLPVWAYCVCFSIVCGLSMLTGDFRPSVNFLPENVCRGEKDSVWDIPWVDTRYGHTDEQPCLEEEESGEWDLITIVTCISNSILFHVVMFCI